VVGKASTIGIEISLTPFLIITGGGQKVQNLASFSTSINFEPVTFENLPRYRTLKQTPCVGMIALCPYQVY